jgi:hypothetical protein
MRLLIDRVTPALRLNQAFELLNARARVGEHASYERVQLLKKKKRKGKRKEQN